jgi:hypothetical protein
VLGIDVSLAMLHVAAADTVAGGWAPRLACADGFQLRCATACSTQSRWLRLATCARVAGAAGLLAGRAPAAVLEAAAPAPGPLAPFARWWIVRDPVGG